MQKKWIMLSDMVVLPINIGTLFEHSPVFFEVLCIWDFWKYKLAEREREREAENDKNANKMNPVELYRGVAMYR